MTVIIVFVLGALLHKNGYIYNGIWQFEESSL